MRTALLVVGCALLSAAPAAAVPLSLTFTGIYSGVPDVFGIQDGTTFSGTITAEDFAEGQNSLFTATLDFGPYVVTGLGTIGFAPTENSVAGLFLEAILRTSSTMGPLAFADDLRFAFDSTGTGGTVNWNGTAFPPGGTPIDYGVHGTITSVTPTPEPASWMLIALGMAGWRLRRHWVRGCG